MVAAVGLGLALRVLAPGASAQSATASTELAEAAALEQEVETLSKDGKTDLAIAKATRVLDLRQKLLPANDSRIGSALGDLGALYLLNEDFGRAAPLLEQAVRIQEQARPGQRELAIAVSNLASLHGKRGEQARAVGLRERAVATYEQALGPRAAEVGTAKRLLGLAVAGTDVARAEALFREALDIHDRAGDGREAVVDLLSLANLRALQSRFRDRATVELYQQAIARSRQALGPDDLVTARLWQTLANYHRAVAVGAGSEAATQETRKLANEQYAEAGRILLARFGPRHTEMANLYSDWAKHAQAMGDFDRAVELRTKANDIEEEHLTAVLATGSESVKLAYLGTLARHAEDTLAMQLAAEWRLLNHQGARRLAATTILRRKGRALDALTESLATLRRRLGPEEQHLLDELLATRAELATAFARGPGSTDAQSYLGRISALQQRAAELEAEVSKRSAEFRVATAPVTIAAVQAHIPERAALVELMVTDIRPAHLASARSEDSSPRRYVAYVLKRHGGICFAGMADADLIESLVTQFRHALGNPHKGNVGDVGWRLYAASLARVEPCLESVDRLLVSPDGALNLVPLGALRDQKGFLAERYEISYLSSGRDLLRYGIGPRPRNAALIVANPDFGPRRSGAGAKGITRGVDVSRLFFPALPGTAEEASAISGLVPSATLLTRERATKTALMGAHGPELLHVATHGFFLTGEAVSKPGGRSLELVHGAEPRPAAAFPLESLVMRAPLLRSGLALAGANRHDESGSDDGILTALEASSLDLFGTELVTLSACETGLGEPEDAEGVFGLRRALVIAGADSQLMSLWKVDDEATRDLMIDFYRRLLGGASRSQALRDAQRSMLGTRATAHPFYWAAFILSGDPGPLRFVQSVDKEQGKGRGGEVPTVEPGARGCGCRLVGGTPLRWSDVGVILLATAGVLTAAGRRRRRPTGYSAQ